MESDLPWLPGAVRELLAADADFMSACQGRVSTRAPSDVTTPYATIQLPTSTGSLGGGVYKSIVQVDGWCAPGGATEPEAAVWLIAVRASRVLGKVGNANYLTMHFSGRVLDLFALPADKSRGDSSPIYRAMTRVELTIHNL